MAASQNPAEYNIIFTMSSWPELAAAAIRLHDKLIADGRPAQASLVRQALLKLRSDLKSISWSTAQHAHRSIVNHEQSSRVRPDTQGRGGERMQQWIGYSAGFEAVPGSVLINHEPTLEDNGVGWWWTNEIGYSGHMGRKFIGSFDGTKPNPSDGMNRTHAVLDMRKGAKNSGKGTIQEPIPARHFVRDGANDAQADWHTRINAAENSYIAAIQSAVAQALAQGRKPKKR